MVSKQIPLVFVACALASAAALPELRTEAVSGGSVFHVRNTAQQPLTAYLIELVNYPGSSYSLFQDEIAAPLAPASEKAIPVANMTVGAVPDYVKITAAVYADGSSAGPPDRVALILAHRKATAETTHDLIARLEKAQSSGAAKPEVSGELKQWADSLEPQGKSHRLNEANVKLAASRGVVADALAYLAQHSVAETLTELGASERALMAGKP